MTDYRNAPAPSSDRITREAREWVVHLSSGRASAADGEAFRRWCARSPEHARAFVHCRQVWQGMEQAATSESIEAGVHPMPRRRSSRFTRRAFLGGAVAASAAGWLALRSPLDLWTRMGMQSADLWTGTGEQREVVLPNAATVQLNTRTSIDVNRQAEQITGLVLNSGETEITTADGNRLPFTVAAQNGLIEARRARFNVRFTDDRVRVTCLDGQVAVRHRHQSVQLQPAQQVVYNTARLSSVQHVDPDRVTAWRQRMLVFNGTPLAQVVDEVNRYRPGQIVLVNDQLGRVPVQAYLSLDKLEDFAALVKEVRGAEVRSLPGGILIIS
ncbi:MAG: FecR domain-containing protein [Alloalcanivorax xenomutans]|jgi:transmembrane sensor